MRLINVDDLMKKLSELETTNPNFVMADVKKLVVDSTTYAYVEGNYLKSEFAKALINCNKDPRIFTKEEIDNMTKIFEEAFNRAV